MDKGNYWFFQITMAIWITISYFVEELGFFIPIIFGVLGMGIVHQLQRLRFELNSDKNRKTKL